MRCAGDLPLSIVYVGQDGTEAMLKATSETVFFYGWEPSALINEGATFMRIYFEAKVTAAPRARRRAGSVGPLRHPAPSQGFR